MIGGAEHTWLEVLVVFIHIPVRAKEAPESEAGVQLCATEPGGACWWPALCYKTWIGLRSPMNSPREKRSKPQHKHSHFSGAGTMAVIPLPARLDRAVLAFIFKNSTIILSHIVQNHHDQLHSGPPARRPACADSSGPNAATDSCHHHDIRSELRRSAVASRQIAGMLPDALSFHLS